MRLLARYTDEPHDVCILALPIIRIALSDFHAFKPDQAYS